MKNAERIVIYGLLAVLSLGALRGTAPSPSAAVADGPAPTSFDALSLTGDKPLVLMNKEGRIAWSESAHDRAYSVGYVNIGRILRQLMNSETFQEEREDLVEELAAEDEEHRERLAALEQRFQSLDPESQEAKQAYQAGLGAAEEYRVWQQSARRRQGALESRHLEGAYRELVEAVEVVCERRSIDIVYRFIPPGEPFETEIPEQAMMAIRLRTTLRSPQDLDITDLVIEELSLEIE